MGKTYLVIGAVSLIVVITIIAFLSRRQRANPLPDDTTLPQIQIQSTSSSSPLGDIGSSPTLTPIVFSFSPPKKSAHYVSNIPSHGETLSSLPSDVSITFNFTLDPRSTINITNDTGQTVGIGDAMIDDSKLTLSRQLSPAAAPGLYTVTYNACWPDGSCHDGNFQFALKP